MYIQATLEREWENLLSPAPHPVDRVFRAKVLSAFLRRKRAEAERLLDQRQKDLQQKSTDPAHLPGSSVRSRSSKRRERAR